jgi:hypothetical protein
MAKVVSAKQLMKDIKGGHDTWMTQLKSINVDPKGIPVQKVG